VDQRLIQSGDVRIRLMLHTGLSSGTDVPLGQTKDLIVILFQDQPVESPPTADLDRSGDKVYESTVNVVRAVTDMSKGVHLARASSYVDLVKV
jgi:hypothetical protein